MIHAFVHQVSRPVRRAHRLVDHFSGSSNCHGCRRTGSLESQFHSADRELGCLPPPPPRPPDEQDKLGALLGLHLRDADLPEGVELLPEGRTATHGDRPRRCPESARRRQGTTGSGSAGRRGHGSFLPARIQGLGLRRGGRAQQGSAGCADPSWTTKLHAEVPWPGCEAVGHREST